MINDDRDYRFRCVANACKQLPQFAVLTTAGDGEELLVSWACFTHFKSDIEPNNAGRFVLRRIAWPTAFEFRPTATAGDPAYDDE